MQTASVYLTMTVSLERYVAVCHPLRARSLCTYGRARIYVIVIVAFSTLYNVPRLWEAKVKSEWSNQFNTTVYCPVQSDFRDNKFYRTVYIHWMYLICMYLVPFLALAILNAAIYNQVSFSLLPKCRCLLVFFFLIKITFSDLRSHSLLRICHQSSHLL